MTTFVLVPGAGGAGHWYWHLVAANLERAGHAARAVDLPGADPSVGLPEYADLVVAAGDGSDEIVLVAQSMGAFTVLGACERLAPARLFFLNAMIPAPGETADAWWDNTRWQADRVAAARAGGYPETVDLDTYFLHDVPPSALAAAPEHDQNEADIAFSQPCDFTAWPAIPTTVLAGRDDRFFPLAFQRRVARERLGLDVVEVPGGHLNALSQPEAVAQALLA
jgi:pimeloyl-ACP methyl ester carboxylesterase